MCKEYIVEKAIINKRASFTDQSICDDVKKKYNVDVDIRTVQKVLSSYISDGVIKYDSHGYKKSENRMICW